MPADSAQFRVIRGVYPQTILLGLKYCLPHSPYEAAATLSAMLGDSLAGQLEFFKNLRHIEERKIKTILNLKKFCLT